MLGTDGRRVDPIWRDPREPVEGRDNRDKGKVKQEVKGRDVSGIGHMERCKVTPAKDVPSTRDLAMPAYKWANMNDEEEEEEDRDLEEGGYARDKEDEGGNE